LTNSYDMYSGARTTYGVSISTSTSSGTRVVTVNLTGTLPGGAVSIQLPVFNSVGVNAVSGGSYNASTHSVSVNSGTTSVTITLAS
ncbi:MAG: hypothetical protein HOV83_20850, partial [Catenulispora sp.]|nr:hypothetical protein [Catenulispora sp.]